MNEEVTWTWSAPPIKPPPSGAELPTEDGIPMETNLHRLLMTLLIESLESHWAPRTDFFADGNMFFYFSARQAQKNDYRGPDFFVVLNTQRKQRESWVVWEEEGRVPDVIVEITSPSTAAVDRGEKKRIYGAGLRIPEYFIYDPSTHELEGYRLGPDNDYEPIKPDAQKRLESRQLKLLLGTQEGTYTGWKDTWLRWYTLDGSLVPTQNEARDQERTARLRVEEERVRAEDARLQAEQKAADLAERLRAYEQRFGALPE